MVTSVRCTCSKVVFEHIASSYKNSRSNKQCSTYPPDRLFGHHSINTNVNVCSADQSPFICEHRFHRRDALELTRLLNHHHRHRRQVPRIQVCGEHAVK